MSYSGCGLFHPVGTGEKLSQNSRYPGWVKKNITSRIALSNLKGFHTLGLLRLWNAGRERVVRFKFYLKMYHVPTQTFSFGYSRETSPAKRNPIALAAKDLPLLTIFQHADLDHISSRCQKMQMLVALSKFLIPHLEHILEETSNIKLAVEEDRNGIVLLRVSKRNSFMKSAIHLPLSVIQRQQHASLSSVFWVAAACFADGSQQSWHVTHNSHEVQLYAKLFLYSFACLTSVKNH